MSFQFKKPLTREQKKLLEDKLKPSQEDIQAAQDSLFLSILLEQADLLQRVKDLEERNS